MLSPPEPGMGISTGLCYHSHPQPCSENTVCKKETRHLQEETAEKAILQKRQQEQQQGTPAETGRQAQPHADFKPQRQGEVPDQWPMFSEAAASRQEQRDTDWPSIEPMVTSGPERYTSESSCQLVTFKYF